MKHFSKTLFASLFMMMVFCGFPSQTPGEEGEPFSPHIERFKNGKIDWDAGMIYGIGRGYPDMNDGSRAAAERIARVTAMQSIVKIASGMNLDDQTILDKLGQGRVAVHINALIRPENHASKWITESNRPCIEVILRTPISGVEGLTTRLLGELKTYPDLWQDFPKKIVTPEVENDEAPWLVVDARGFSGSKEVKPALFPKIKNQSGEILYELKTVDEAAVQKRGMARYVVTAEPKERIIGKKGLSETLLLAVHELLDAKEAFADEAKKKRRRFIVTDAVNTEGMSKVNLLVSNDEAARLKKEDESSMILKKCRVIVIVNSPIGGVKGTLDNLFFLSGNERP